MMPQSAKLIHVLVFGMYDEYDHLFQFSTQDPCTQMHTAANDQRSGSTWKACDDTGLLVMVCRHDDALAFVNIVQSGEKYVDRLLLCICDEDFMMLTLPVV